MTNATPAVGRIDRIIQDMERLQAEAQDIFDTHIDFVRCLAPTIPFGVLKFREIAEPAGNTLNHISGLKIVRKKLTGG